MKPNNLPEEKLLRLIRGQRDSYAGDNKMLSAGAGERGKPSFEDASRKFSLENLSFYNIRWILAAFFSLACVYLIAVFVYPVITEQEAKLPQPEPDKQTTRDTDINIDQKPYDFYLKGVSGRQVFKGSSVTGGNQVTNQPLNGVNAADAAKDISLIGIIQKDNPQVIIEDKKTQKTYYVTKGQFAGEFQVESIEAEKVIINYRGQRFELYL